MKHIAILYSEYTPTIDAIKFQLKDCIVDCLTEPAKNDDYDLVILPGKNNTVKYSGNAIKTHYSLLPAFNTEEPVKDAMITGVKITGITVYNTLTKKIIAQYPVFINNSTHYDELENQLMYLEQTLLPIIAEKILNNEIIENKYLLNSSCGKNCGGCSSCNH